MRYSNRQLNQIAGFGTLELLCVTAITAILAAVATPSLSALITESRLTSTMNLLSKDLNFARTEAIKRSVPVLVCPGHSKCQDKTGNWKDGWQICYDADGNNACDSAGPDGPNPIRTRPEISRDQVLTVTGAGSRIRFNPVGVTGSLVTFSLASEQAMQAGEGRLRICKILPAGAIRIQTNEI